MTIPPEEKNVFEDFEVTYRRPLRRFQVFVWVMMAIQFALMSSLPHFHLSRSANVAIGVAPTFIMLAGVIALLWWLAPHHPLVTQMRPAARRLAGRAAIAVLLYLAVFAAVTWYYQARHPSGAAATLAALAPSIPLLFVIRALLLFLKEESDEFLRARMLEGWAIATCLTLAACALWGFLDQFEVVPHLPLWAAFPLWAGALVPAHFLLQRRDA